VVIDARPMKLSTLANGDMAVVLHIPFDRGGPAWELRKLQNMLCRVELYLEEG